MNKIYFVSEWKCNECGYSFTASNDTNGCSKCGSANIKKIN